MTNWFNRIGVAEVLIESGTLRVGDDALIIGPTTGVLEFKVEDLRVEMKPAQQAGKGIYCSVAVPVSEMPEDRVTDHPAKEAEERLHPRRGDRVYLWVDSSLRSE